MAPSKIDSATQTVTDPLKKVKLSVKKKNWSSTNGKVAEAPSELALTNISDTKSHSCEFSARVASSVPNIDLNNTSMIQITSSSTHQANNNMRHELNNASMFDTNTISRFSMNSFMANTINTSTVNECGMSSFSANVAGEAAGAPSTGPQLVLNAPGIVIPTRPLVIKSAEAPMAFPEYHVNAQGYSFFLAPYSSQQGSSSAAASSTMSSPSSLVMPAANGRCFGKDASGTTVGHPLQDVSLKNLHPLLFQLEPGQKKSFADTEVPDLKDANDRLIKNTKGHELRDILSLPRYITRNFEAGLYLENFRRLDSRFEVTDIFDRMDVDVFETGKKDPVAKSIKNSWSNQRGRLRAKINAKAWKEAREMPTKASVLNAGVATTASNVEREQKVLARAKPARKPRKSRAKPKATNSILAAAQQSLPAHATMSDTFIDPRLLSTGASTANNVVSVADGAVDAYTRNAQFWSDLEHNLDEPATFGDGVNDEMVAYTQTHATTSHNGCFAEIQSSNLDIETPAIDVAENSGSSQNGETHLSSLPTLSGGFSEVNTPSDNSVYTPAAPYDPALPSSAMDSELRLAGHGSLFSNDWYPEKEFMGSDELSF